MINHYRSLLRNLPGPVLPDGTPGEEYVPPFAPVPLPAFLASVRAVLFGADPDAALVRFRLRQLLAVVHASPLVEAVLALDPRVTYPATDADDLASDAPYRPAVTRLGGTAADVLTVAGVPAAPDASGRSYRAYRVQPTGSGTVAVAAQQPPFSNPVLDWAPDAWLPLAGSGYQFQVTADNPGAAWLVEATNRPQLGPGALVAGLEAVGESSLVRLFGASPAGLYATLASLWYDQRETPLRLAAIVTALVYRTEERRLASAGSP